MSPSKPRLAASQGTLSIRPIEYQWIDGPTSVDDFTRARWLVATDGMSPDYLYRSGDPNISGLFLEFAFLEQNEAAILLFVYKYGDLGIRTPWPKGGDARIHSGEQFVGWVNEIRGMRAAVELAGAVSEGKTSLLRRWISFPNTQSVQFERTEREAKTNRRVSRKDPIGRYLQKNKWKRAARIILADMVNVRLRGSTSTQLVFDARLEELAFDSSSTSLRTAMWRDFGETISVGKIVRCKACPTLMRLVPGIARSDKATCSTNCRVKYSNQTKKKAEAAKRRKKK